MRRQARGRHVTECTPAPTGVDCPGPALRRASAGAAMSTAYALGLGIIAGIILFFVLQRCGVIDRWLRWLER